MLGFPTDTKHEPKCTVTYGVMGHLDPKQPPTKRKPFVSVMNHHFVQKTELIVPDELYEIIKNEAFLEKNTPKYSRVIMTLGEITSGEFFNEYIKRGNVLMLSEWRTGVDKVYTLRDGILTLYLDKESYEKAGLVGKPDGVKGKRGTKPRWVVEINLRLPSMLHGKKGFERIVYAFKNVLNTPVTWLFCDLGKQPLVNDPLEVKFPHRVTVQPKVFTDIEVSLPPLTPPTSDINIGYESEFEDFAVETHEWFSLVSLDSPRVKLDDKVDSFLCRYVPPGETHMKSRLVSITWKGFFPSSWAHNLLVEMLQNTPADVWFSMSTLGFGIGWAGDIKDCMILKPPNAPKEYILWEVGR
ncbi:ribonuclease P 40kDa subunit [Calycina marina]|uniref:Ribonuclease P 40kDa subunit n=1 Tax=Calycina marina TaxID=1763456 RepID=A0A9P7ZA59_9HELO|nr:ribonuclease P 40kDa subunit [Calycina marina]